MLDADDLALTADTEERVQDMFNRWKAWMDLKGVKINMEKTNFM